MDMGAIVESIKNGLIIARSIFYKVVLTILKPIVYLDPKYKYAILFTLLSLALLFWVYYYTQRRNVYAVICN